MTLQQKLAEARSRLVSAGIAVAEASIDVELYARTILDWDRARLLIEYPGPVPGALEPTFAWTVVGDGAEFAVGELRFTTSRTDHYIETLAVRVDGPDGSSLAYSADTGPDWSLDRLGRGVDLALVEATYGTDAEVEGIKHLSAGQAGAMARAAGARRCVLTHFWPGSDLTVHAREGGAAYGAPVTIASPNVRYQL